MPEAFERLYTDAQKEAMAEAHVDQRVPAKRIVELATLDQLSYRGETVGPWKVLPKTHTVYAEAHRLRKQRAGKVDSPLSHKEPRDAVEILRRRLVNVADAELRKLENQKAGVRDLPRLEQVAKVVRQAAAIPGPKDPRPNPVGSKQGMSKQTEPIPQGIGATIIAAARTDRTSAHSPAPEHPKQRTDNGENTGTDHDTENTSVSTLAPTLTANPDTTNPQPEPGSLVAELARLAAGRE